MEFCYVHIPIFSEIVVAFFGGDQKNMQVFRKTTVRKYASTYEKENQKLYLNDVGGLGKKITLPLYMALFL